MTDSDRIEAKLKEALNRRVAWSTVIVISVLMAIFSGLITHIAVR